MKINYTIKLPVTNSVDLNNNYGAISINNLDGNAKICCERPDENKHCNEGNDGIEGEKTRSREGFRERATHKDGEHVSNDQRPDDGEGQVQLGGEHLRPWLDPHRNECG